MAATVKTIRLERQHRPSDMERVMGILSCYRDGNGERINKQLANTQVYMKTAQGRTSQATILFQFEWLREAYRVIPENIPRPIALMESENNVFYLMERIPGRDLNVHIRNNLRTLPASPKEVACQLDAAIKAIHRTGLTHRDLVPLNIIIRRDGRLVLIDPSIAYHLEMSLYGESDLKKRCSVEDRSKDGREMDLENAHQIRRILAARTRATMAKLYSVYELPTSGDGWIL